MNYKFSSAILNAKRLATKSIRNKTLFRFLKKVYTILTMPLVAYQTSRFLTFASCMTLISPKKNEVTLRTKDGMTLYMRINSTDFEVFKKVFLNQEYLLDEDVDVGKSVSIFDCGANNGYSTLFFRSKFPNAKIVAIEPDNNNFRLLEKNCRKHDVQFEKAAVWSIKTELDLVNSNNQDWSFRTVEKSVESKNTVVQTVTINDLMTKYNISEITILKMDIEGAEVNLFNDKNKAWLDKTKIILIEFHDKYIPGSSKKIRNVLKKHKFAESQRGENYIYIRR